MSLRPHHFLQAGAELAAERVAETQAALELAYDEYFDPRKSLDEEYVLSRSSSERSFRAPTPHVLYGGWFDVCRGDVLNLTRGAFRRRYVVISTFAITIWQPVWVAEVGSDVSRAGAAAEAARRFRSMPARLKEACESICDGFVLSDEVPLESVRSADLRKTARSDFTFNDREVRSTDHFQNF